MSWRLDAACAGLDPEPWMEPARYPEGRAVCAACPVSSECLTDALAYPWTADRATLRAGLNPTERAQLRRTRKQAA
jgi:hypothetical protein